MKKYIVIIALFLGFASITNAQSFIFSNDLSVGVSGSDVSTLQTWLIGNGYDIPAISSGRAVKGYFGSQTRTAVIRFQSTQGLPPTGFFGPLTRGRVNGGFSQGKSLRITSPNGNEVWAKGTVQNISWTGAQGILNQTANITVVPRVPACAEPGPGPRCLMAIQAPYPIAQVNLNSASYSWSVGNYQAVTCLGLNCVAPTIPEGEYKVQICSFDSSVCDTSDGYFTIGTQNTSSSLQVTSPNGGESWTAYATQGLRWNTSSLSSNTLLDIYLDQTNIYCITTPCGATYTLDKNIPVSMTYNWIVATDMNNAQIPAGDYKLRICIAGSTTNCDSSERHFTIQANGTGPLTVVSPNGGETFVAGTAQNIIWTSPTYARTTYADVKLISYYDPMLCPAGYTCMPAPQRIYTLASNININQNSLSWIVGNYTSVNYPTEAVNIVGRFTIQVCEAGTNNCDSSNAPFTILRAATL